MYIMLLYLFAKLDGHWSRKNCRHGSVKYFIVAFSVCTGFSLCWFLTYIHLLHICSHSQVTEEESDFLPYDPSQEPIFPSELQVTHVVYMQSGNEPCCMLLGTLKSGYIEFALLESYVDATPSVMLSPAVAMAAEVHCQRPPEWPAFAEILTRRIILYSPSLNESHSLRSTGCYLIYSLISFGHTVVTSSSFVLWCGMYNNRLPGSLNKSGIICIRSNKKSILL